LGQLGLDKVIFVPAFIPPHKAGKSIIAPEHRLGMIRLAVGDNRYFFVSDIEIKRKGKSYTVDTLREIKKEYLRSELFFICGSDLVNEIPTWKNVEEIHKLARFVLAKRPGFGKRLAGRDFLKINVAQVDISSSLIRYLVKKDMSIRYLTPDKVVAYIRKYRLYR